LADADAIALRRGRQLEAVTLGWNVAGVIILAFAALTARSVALAGFGLDSVVEIGASTVVLWELAGIDESRQRRASKSIGVAFLAVALYLGAQSTIVLVVGFRPHHSPTGIVWTALTSLVMFTLASGKARVGAALNNPVLQLEGRVTFIDGVLAAAVLIGLGLNALVGWWWADPVTGYVILFYALVEAHGSLRN
jgi:divalent metal cation (Fe/Co/Zn/Cd) transporter